MSDHKKLLRLGWKHLVKAHHRSVGGADSSAVYDRKDIYQRFLAAGVEEKGSYAYLFAERGKARGGTAGINFGDLVLPHFLNLSLQFAGEFQARKVLLPIVHRTFAKGLGSHRFAGLTKWATDNPVSFLVLSGKYRIVSVSMQGDAGFQVPELEIETGIDLIDFGISAGASIGGEFSGHFFTTRDDPPKAYRSALSKDMVADFNTLFGDDECLIVDDFIVWYHEHFDRFVKPLLDETKSKLLKEASATRLPRIPFRKAKQLSQKQEAARILDALFNAIADPLAADRFEDSELLKDLNRFHKRIVEADRDSEVALRAREEASKSKPALCFLDVLSLSPTGSAGAGAGVKGKVFELKPQVDVGAEGSVTGMMKKSYSRFQNFQKSEHPGASVVMTQDVVVSYSQIKLKGATSLQLPVRGIRDRAKSGAALLHNRMSYYAATSLWMSDASTREGIPLQSGSGVSFGISVRFAALFEIAKVEHSGAESDDELTKKKDKLVKEWSSQLKVEKEDFVEFVKAIFGAEDFANDSSIMYPELMGDQPLMEFILIESAFIFVDPPRVAGKTTEKTRKSIGDPIQDANFKTIFKRKTGPDALSKMQIQLESLRVRIRVADHYENAQRDSVFHLGFSVGRTGAKFTLDSVTDAGNEGVFSMFTYFFDNDVFADDEELRSEPEPAEAIGIRRNTDERRESTVPPVFLPPHTLRTE